MSAAASAPFRWSPLCSASHLPAKKRGQGWGNSLDARVRDLAAHPLTSHCTWVKRKVSVYAVNQDAERSLKKTLEVDRLIDMLKVSNTREMILEIPPIKL